MRFDELSFLQNLQEIEINLNPAQYKKLFTYLQKLLDANQTTNLTAITDYSQALIKHLFDSLLILKHDVFLKARRILDVGSGGGLPSIPLAICCPEKQFISLEATKKKVNFQSQICQDLTIPNHFACWGRSEEYAHDQRHRETYDLVIARALATANTLAELTLPFLALSGHAIFYKAKDYQNELQTAESAITILGCRILDRVSITLPGQYGERNLIIIKKVKPSPSQYPRRPGLPQKSPLK
jgi:16S rRNA (guanine527-N7)-methyltransferase